MEETAYTCKVCGKSFSNSRALGSHMHYKHGSREGGGEILDLKEEFRELLMDLGIKAGKSRVLSDIYFDLDPQDLEKLDELLRLSGITNPVRGLILQRWSQRVGKPLPKDLLKESTEESSEPIFELYDKMAQHELRQLLLEDLRSRIEERRHKLGLKEPRRDEEKGLEVRCPCMVPLGYVVFGQDGGMTHFCTLKQKPCPFYAPVELATCSHCHLDIRIDGLPIGAPFMCPRCGAEHIKTHPGRIVLAKSYAPLPMLQ